MATIKFILGIVKILFKTAIGSLIWFSGVELYLKLT